MAATPQGESGGAAKTPAKAPAGVAAGGTAKTAAAGGAGAAADAAKGALAGTAARSPGPAESPDGSSPRLRRALDRNSFIAGLCVALVLNGGGLLALWWMNRQTSHLLHKDAEVFVDAKLVRFGKKRDLSFLPHVQSQPKVADKPKALKLALDPDKPTKKDEPKRIEDLSKLTDRLKNLRAEEDDRVKHENLEEGDPLGARGGSAAEASGDPYILEIMAAVLERWTVPTMITPGDLLKLNAAACLTINDDGKLVSFKIVEVSGNSLFDGSLMATLGSIKELPKPHGRYAKAARTGKLCPSFSKQ